MSLDLSVAVIPAFPFDLSVSVFAVHQRYTCVDFAICQPQCKLNGQFSQSVSALYFVIFSSRWTRFCLRFLGLLNSVELILYASRYRSRQNSISYHSSWQHALCPILGVMRCCFISITVSVSVTKHHKSSSNLYTHTSFAYLP